MTKKELFQAYLLWLGETLGPASRSFTSVTPFANADIFEDELRLVNRLYYIIPKLSAGHVECFIFYEENEFLNDANGNLVLTKTDYYIYEA